MGGRSGDGGGRVNVTEELLKTNKYTQNKNMTLIHACMHTYIHAYTCIYMSEEPRTKGSTKRM